MLTTTLPGRQVVTDTLSRRYETSYITDRPPSRLRDWTAAAWSLTGITTAACIALVVITVTARLVGWVT